MKNLYFRFNIEKFIQALVFFSKHEIPDLTKLKIAKLLYFADKAHLLRYGRPIIGDAYFALPHGPLPSTADDFMDEAEDAVENGAETPEQEKFCAYLDIDSSEKLPRVVAKGPERFEVFSQSELTVLSEIVEQFGKLDGWTLRDVSHKERAWIEAYDRRPENTFRSPMPYESFFDESADSAILEVARAEQEDRDFVAMMG